MNVDLKKQLLEFTDLFNAGMDRNISPISSCGMIGRWLNLGAGEKKFTWAIPLQLPEWNAETDALPFNSEHIHGIVAFHFFEHVTPGRIPGLLSECLRVLKPDGTLTICVPHRLGGMAFQDLDHKSFFTENTWRILMGNPYYKTKWKNELDAFFEINFNLIAGDSERTLALFTQFTKRIGNESN